MTKIQLFGLIAFLFVCALVAALINMETPKPMERTVWKTISIYDTVEVKRTVIDTQKLEVVDTIQRELFDTIPVVRNRKGEIAFPQYGLFIHCTATPEHRDLTFGQVNQIAYNRFNIKSYHYIVNIHGEIHLNYDDETPGQIARDEIFAGAYGFNRNFKHAVYIGGTDKRLKPKFTLTNAQLNALVEVVEREIEVNPHLIIVPHFAVAHKACPVFDVRKLLVSRGIEAWRIMESEEEVRAYIRKYKRMNVNVF